MVNVAHRVVLCFNMLMFRSLCVSLLGFATVTMIASPTARLLAADFKQKTRWSSVWPNMHYGAMYLPYSVGRQMPMKSVNWVTRDSNRLSNFTDRYAAVLRDLDTKRNEEELNIAPTDVRWCDHRRLYWRCSFCGSTYRKNVSVRIKFHAGCNFCKGKYPSEVRKAECVSTSLQDHDADLAAKLSGEAQYCSNVAQLSATSKLRAEWKCEKCGEPFRTSIRSRTGLVEPGQAPLHPDIAAWSACCPSCRWQSQMNELAKRIVSEGQYLGLEVDDDVSEA